MTSLLTDTRRACHTLYVAVNVTNRYIFRGRRVSVNIIWLNGTKGTRGLNFDDRMVSTRGHLNTPMDRLRAVVAIESSMSLGNVMSWHSPLACKLRVAAVTM